MIRLLLILLGLVGFAFGRKAYQASGLGHMGYRFGDWDHTKNLETTGRNGTLCSIQNNTSDLPQYNQNTGSDLAPSQRNYFGGLNVYPKVTDDNQLKALAGALGIKYFNA